MGYNLSDSQFNNEMKALLDSGAGGTAEDFYKWLRMEIKRKFREFPDLTEEKVRGYLDSQVESGGALLDSYGAGEYRVAEVSAKKTGAGKDAYFFIGGIEFSPMQFVRSKLEYFLRKNNVSDDLIMDISIGTVEAVENAVKYGNGELVEVKYSVSRNGRFDIEMVNRMGKTSIDEDIQRGKFSETTTLMRGMMVMQKLFDEIDLDIQDNNSVVYFTAHKNVR